MLEFDRRISCPAKLLKDLLETLESETHKTHSVVCTLAHTYLEKCTRKSTSYLDRPDRVSSSTTLNSLSLAKKRQKHSQRSNQTLWINYYPRYVR